MSNQLAQTSSPAGGWKFHHRRRWILYLLLGIAAAMLCLLLSDRAAIWQCVSSANLNQCFFLGKTTWDWIDKLLLPAIFAVVGFQADQYLKQRDQKQRDADKRLAHDRERQITLLNYFEQMTKLMLDEAWPLSDQAEFERLLDNADQDTAQSSTEDEDANQRITAVARARTLVVLRQLDGARKGDVIRFLAEAGALPFIRLDRADPVCLTQVL